MWLVRPVTARFSRAARLPQAHKANSHAKQGWEQFTDAVIEHISESRKGVVFVLWGKHAQVRLPRRT